MTTAFLYKFVLLCIIITTAVNGQPGRPRDDDDNSDLRTVMRLVREQNRRLTQQQNRLQQVWSGMQEMCTAVEACACDSKSDSQSNTEVPMHVLSVESSGSRGGNEDLVVTVTWVAPPQHTSEWLWRQGSMVRTAGKNLTSQDSALISQITIPSPANIMYLHFRAYSEKQFLGIEFNMSAVFAPGKQESDAPDPDLMKVFLKPGTSDSFSAPDNASDVTLTGFIGLTQQEMKDMRNPGTPSMMEVFFTSVNTSSNPPAVIELFNGMDYEMTSHPFDSTDGLGTEFTITIPTEYARYGGILSAVAKHMNLAQGLIAEYSTGKTFKILAAGSEDVLPENTLAVSIFNVYVPNDEMALIPGELSSLVCFAMGNPLTDVSIWKEGKKGKETQMETDTLIHDSVTNLVSHTFSTTPQRRDEGLYTCRATSGNTTINKVTQVEIGERAVFDESKSGVIKNTTDVVAVACSARGKPIPRLEMNLYQDYGPDLLELGLFKVRRKEGGKSSRVIMTIYPDKDDNYHKMNKIVCRLHQPFYEDSYEFELFPGSEEVDWDFYYELQDLRYASTANDTSHY